MYIYIHTYMHMHISHNRYILGETHIVSLFTN